MQRSRSTVSIGAVLLVAISAVVGCAGEIAPDPGPSLEPLNPQPLPPVNGDKAPNPPPSTVGGSHDGENSSGSSGASTSGSTGSGSSSSSSSSSSSGGSVDASGQ